MGGGKPTPLVLVSIRMARQKSSPRYTRMVLSSACPAAEAYCTASRPTCLHNLGEISNVFLLKSFLAGLGELRVQDRFNPLKVRPKRAWFLARGRETARQQFAQPLTGLVQLGFGIPNRAAQNPRDLIVLISLNVVQN